MFDRPEKYPPEKTTADRTNPKVNAFLQSLGEILIETTALEVSTIVVEEIILHKFIPHQTYWEIYRICPSFLENMEIHDSLIDRYLQLHRTLLAKYISLIEDAQSSLYHPALLDAVQESYQLLVNGANELRESSLQLPDPATSRDAKQLQNLLNNYSFLRCLRKLGEIKAILDQRNYRLQTKSEASTTDLLSDVIYAKTTLQLEGDVLNSYNKKLFQHPQQQAILHIHQEGVNAAQQHWQGLLEFLIDLGSRAFPRR